MANILFVNTSHWSFGELMIAVEFAADVVEGGHKILFLVPHKHCEVVEKRGFTALSLIPKSRALNLMQLSAIKSSFKPDLIVTADFINFAYAYRHYEIDIEDLLKVSSELATFDIFDWTMVRQYPVDVYGLKSKIREEVCIEPYKYRFSPCPICNPVMIKDERNYHYSIMNQNQIRRIKNMYTKEQRRIKYGLPVDKKIIIISFADWQVNSIKHPRVQNFVNISNAVFTELIRTLVQSYMIISVGTVPPDIFEIPKLQHFNSMNSEDFDNLALAADLYISRNVTSTTMARLFCLGLNSVCIINSKLYLKEIEMKNLQNYCRPMDFEYTKEKYYKYMMFPVGWYNFLEPLVKNNQYYNLVELCEQFDTEHIRETVRRKIVENDPRVRDEYMNQLEKLPEPNQIIRFITKE